MLEMEEQEDWPPAFMEDLLGLRRNLRRSIERLEAAYDAGTIDQDLVDEERRVLGPYLHHAYSRLASTSRTPSHASRGPAVVALLTQMDNDLHPAAIAFAEIPHDHVLPRSALASLDDGPVSVLRLDQMIDAAFWRIGFTFAKLPPARAYRRELARRITRKLASDLLSLHRILAHFTAERPLSARVIVSSTRDKHFEHLILDILNEDAPRAHIASLEEDFLEKTDLRVKYPGLARKRGARVQVTAMVDPDRLSEKKSSIRRVDELVFLSPRSLAEYALHARGSKSPSEAVDGFWQDLGSRARSEAHLAAEISRSLRRAFDSPMASPEGPVAFVNPSLKRLIRSFVEEKSMESTHALRERENAINDDRAERAAAVTIARQSTCA